jgi:queuine tRNA-ribosyltransferase
LNTLHNLFYYEQLMAKLREAIANGRLDGYVAEFRALHQKSAAKTARLL